MDWQKVEYQTFQIMWSTKPDSDCPPPTDTEPRTDSQAADPDPNIASPHEVDMISPDDADTPLGEPGTQLLHTTGLASPAPLPTTSTHSSVAGCNPEPFWCLSRKQYLFWRPPRAYREMNFRSLMACRMHRVGRVGTATTGHIPAGLMVALTLAAGERDRAIKRERVSLVHSSGLGTSS
ncbi:hypothetical protein LTR95_002456 [Oleoguttula sp. CCFEE 5521]